MEDKPNYYAIIPANVRYDSNLKDKAKLLYGEITALSNKNGICFASNSYFAKLYNVTNTTISLLIKDLIDNGYIEREIIYKDGTKEIENRYLRIFKEGYLRNLKGGIQENLKDNNTSINNTSINIYTTIDMENENSSNLIDYLEQNGFNLTPIQYEVVQQWKDNELTRHAIKKAVLNNKININYIDKILYSYQKDNIKTVQQAMEREEEFNTKRDLYYKNKYEHKESRYEREQRLLREMLSDEED